MLTPYESNIPRPISPLAGVVANIMNTPKVAELDDKQWRARQQALRETELALADAREDDRAGIAEAYAGTRDWTAVDDDSDDDDDDDARWREGGRWRERRRPDEETATYAAIRAPSNVDRQRIAAPSGGSCAAKEAGLSDARSRAFEGLPASSTPRNPSPR